MEEWTRDYDDRRELSLLGRSPGVQFRKIQRPDYVLYVTHEHVDQEDGDYAMGTMVSEETGPVLISMRGTRIHPLHFMERMVQEAEIKLAEARREP